MSNNDVDYTPDFEASENDTSQLVSGQSEILDEAESATASKVEEKDSPPFTSNSTQNDKSVSNKPESRETSQSQDTSPAVKNKELEEIEDIIRKLERLEKAQTLLEDALHLSDAEQDLADISERSERSVASSYRSGKKSASKTSNPVSSAGEDESKHDHDLSSAINTGLASIREIMEKDLGETKEEPRPPTPPSVSAASWKSKKSISITRSSSHSLSRAKVAPSSKRIDGTGDHDGPKPGFPILESPPESVLKLKSEVARQETLILAYQKENEKLYGQLKAAQDELAAKEGRHEEEVNGLKTEIATLKLNRLASVTAAASGSSSPRLGSAHKGELDRLNDELTAKSLMIVELRKEIALLKVERDSRPVKRVKSPMLSVDKEKDYQDKIRALQKQVRTLQRILYSKEPVRPAATPSSGSRVSLATKGRALSLGKFEVARRAVSATNVEPDASAVKKLEERLRKERSDFQAELGRKQKLIEERDLEINTLKLELSKKQAEPGAGGSQDNEAESAILEQLQNRLLNQSEIIQGLKEQVNALKGVEQERDALRREVGHLESRMKELQKKLTRAETMGRPSFRAGSAPGKVNDPLKPAMNQEKEKDYQKQIQNLQKQVRTLQKILYSKNPAAAAAAATSASSAPGLNRPSMLHSGSREDLFGNKARPTSVGRPEAVKKTNITPAHKPDYNAQVLQATFEQERRELEQLLEHKQRLIDAREREIRELKSKLSATIEENAWISSESASGKANYEEFRVKLATQNKIIESLQQRLASYGNIEAEKCLLKKEISQLEFRVQDLQRRLARAEGLARPENEVLATLSEKVEDLHTRYFYRERQLDTLLDRLSVKTGAISMSPRSLNSFRARNGNHYGTTAGLGREDFPYGSLSRSNNNGLDLGELSPSATMHLIPHRDVPEM